MDPQNTEDNEKTPMPSLLTSTSLANHIYPTLGKTTYLNPTVTSVTVICRVWYF